MEYSAESRLALRALTELVRIKLVETLREKMSGTYAPTIASAATKVPVPQYQITTVYSSSPENVELLSRAVFAVVDTLQRRGPSQTDVDKVKEELLRAHELELQQNAYWLSELTARDRDEEDFGAELANYDGLVRRRFVLPRTGTSTRNDMCVWCWCRRIGNSQMPDARRQGTWT